MRLVALALLLGAAVLEVRAADPGLAAKVLSADGQVSVLRNGDLWALFAGGAVRVGETIVTGPEGFARLEISDGSSFDVYPNSRVAFRVNPGNWRDLVEVFLGKIKVRIQKLGGPNLYKVYSPTAVISVRGTVFDVDVEEDTVTSVSVEEGLVEVWHRLLPSGRAVPLLPGQSLRIFPNAALAAAAVNKLGIAGKVAEAARDMLTSLPRMGGGGRAPSGTGPAPAPAPGGGGLPTDTGAPPPPPSQPTDREAPAPPPPGSP
jgi:hypothetical protein